MADYRCSYCTERCHTFEEIIRHLSEIHSTKELKFMRQEECKLKTLNFKVVPELCREQGRVITLNSETERVHVSRASVIPKDSPYKKVVKSSENVLACDDDVSGVESIGDIEEDGEYNELISLIPDVIDELKRSGKLEDYLSFHRLVSVGKFPLDNIAYLLFMDVVRWFSLDNVTSTMRYTDNVKLFWETGLRLFHGRFLRFMGGPKNAGQIVEGTAKLGECSPEDSKVNFVVPHRNVLQDERKFVSANPGILNEMLDTITKCNVNTKTYKLCVDGKKINPTSKGEIHLWGYEDPPTLEERRHRQTEEIAAYIYIRTQHWYIENNLCMQSKRTNTFFFKNNIHLINITIRYTFFKNVQTNLCLWHLCSYGQLYKRCTIMTRRTSIS
jgi:hypothetical protein